MIPKVIYMCHRNLFQINIFSQNWIRLNPEYKIRLYDDKLCEDFLLSNFSNFHCNFFKSIPDGPIKADFWRICIIYIHGGVYVDADIEPLIPLKEYLSEDADLVTCIIRTNLYNPHFIAAKKNNHYLKLCIEKYMEYYLEHKEYSYTNYSIVEVFSQLFNYDFSNEGIYFVGENKYQLLQNVYENGEKNEHCMWNNMRVFNNRYSMYNSKSHDFS